MTAATSGQALAIGYRAPSGRRREALVGVDDAGGWAVYDVPAGGRGKTGRLVERLTGENERLRAALGLHAEYAACQRAYSAGERANHLWPNPLPSATRISLAEIRVDAARALALAFALAESAEDADLLDQLRALAGDSSTAAGSAVAA